MSGQRLVVPEGLPGLHDRARQLTGRRGVEGDVDEARSGDLHRRDALGFAQPSGEQLGKLPRCHARLLGQLQSHGGGPVAVASALGSLDDDRLRDLDGQLTGLDGLGEHMGHC